MADMETRVWQAYKDRNVVLLGVNIDEPAAVVEDFINQFKLTYPVLLGNSPLKASYNIAGTYVSPFPRDYIIGSNGRIIYAGDEFDPEEIGRVISEDLNSGRPVAGSSDFDSNGRVDFQDFVMFVQGFGGTDPLLDLNGNGRVDFPDFVIFANDFGGSPQRRGGRGENQ